MRREGGQRGVARGERALRRGGVERVDEEILGQRKGEALERPVQSGSRDVVFALRIDVGLHAANVLRMEVAVARPAVIELRLRFEVKLRGEAVLVIYLHEAVPVLEPLRVVIIIEDDGAREAPVRIEPIPFEAQLTRALPVGKEVQLRAPGIDVAVLSLFVGDDVAIGEGEGILPVRPRPIALEREGIIIRNALLVAERRIEQPERSRAYFPLEMERLPVSELRRTRPDAQGAGRGIHARGLEDIVRLSDGERNLLHVVEREAADVDLPALRVGDGHAIVTHRRMLCAQAPHRHRFESADAPIILHRDAGELLYCLREVCQSQPFEPFRVQRLDGRRCLDEREAALAHYFHVREFVHLRRVNGLSAHWERTNECQYTTYYIPYHCL